MNRYTIHPHNSGGYNLKLTSLKGDEVVVLLDDAEAAIEAARDEGYRQGKEEWEEANAAEYWRGKREGQVEERKKVEEKLRVTREALQMVNLKRAAELKQLQIARDAMQETVVVVAGITRGLRAQNNTASLHLTNAVADLREALAKIGGEHAD